MPAATPQSRWAVLKFGGTSVATPAGWKVIEEAASQALADGFEPLIVCSALAGISDRLEVLLDQVASGALQSRPEAIHEDVETIRQQHRDLATEAGIDFSGDDPLDEIFGGMERHLFGAALVAEATPKLRARVMAAGELASTVLGSQILGRLLPQRTVRWHDARELLTTSGTERSDARRYLAASCPPGADESLASRLGAGEAGTVHITQGFIASTPDGETALLGRGGSDVSAAVLAERLRAARFEIWSDVPGFFTADPRFVPSARLLRQIGYAEAQELASTGAKVLHPRVIEIIRRSELDLRMRCTLRPEAEGTLVSGHAPDAGEGVVALSVKRNVTVLTMETAGMWQQVGFLADVFAVFKQYSISVDLVSTSETSVSVTLDPLANALNPEVVEKVMEELSAYCQPRLAAGLAAISLVGTGLRKVLPELAPALEALHGQSVYLLSQAASDLNLSVVVDADQVDRIVRELHAGFFGAVTEGAIFGPTFDRVLAEPIERPHETAWWVRRREELLEIASGETPHYVYDLETIRAAALQLKGVAALDRVLYAVKANAHPAILQALADEGLGFECVSLGEVEHVMRHLPALSPREILFTPNFAPRHEYERVLEMGVRLTIDNLFIGEAWPELLKDREIFVRIDPGHGRGHHAGVRTAGPGSKFGIAPEMLPRFRELADGAGARVVGLHAHLGSGITDPLAWAETAATLAGYLDLFPEVTALDLGGGLAAPGATGSGFDVETASRHLDAFKSLNPHVELWLEPGRFFVAEAGVVLTRVTQRKAKGDTAFVGVDAGMHTLIRPALYGAYHEIVNLSRLDDPPELTAEVVGPICETADVLGHSRRLPWSEEGDVFLIATAGAYGRVMGSTYNQRPFPPETVLI